MPPKLLSVENVIDCDPTSQRTELVVCFKENKWPICGGRQKEKIDVLKQTFLNMLFLQIIKLEDIKLC